MFKPLSVCLCTLSLVTLLSACGNKGELYLPEDPQITRELDVIDDADALTADDGLLEADVDDTDEDDKPSSRKSASDALSQ